MGLIKVAIIDDLPTPYRNHLFLEITRLKNFDLEVIYLAESGNEKKWILDQHLDFKKNSLPCFQYYSPSFDIRYQFTWGVFRALKRINPDVVVVGGYHQFGYWTALLYAKIYSKKLILWSGTTKYSERLGAGIIVKLLKKCYFRHIDGALAYGSDAQDYLIGYGIPVEKIHIVLNTTNLTRIRQACLDSFLEVKNLDEVRLLFIGRLTKFKGIQAAFHALSECKNKQIQFRIVGDGPYKRELEDLAASLGLSSQIEFTGYQQQSMLTSHLAWADIFMFPSYQEVWGIVVNEALAAGLYVMSSSLAGVTRDLIMHGINGESIDPRNIELFGSQIEAALEKIKEIRANRDGRSLWAMNYSTQAISKEFVRAILQMINEGEGH